MISSSSMTRMEECVIASDPLRLRQTARVGERQADGEPRALADMAVARDRAAVLLHDAVGNREPQPGALADFLGREERIVDPRQLLRGNAGARVADLHDRAVLVLARDD